MKKITLKKKYVLSIDVAIKHLSFCILSNSKICDWQLIDLLADSIKINICSGNKKDGSKCENAAKWKSDTNNDCYCGIHKPETAIGIPKKLTCHCNNLAKYINDAGCGECEKHNTTCGRNRWYTVDNINDIELRVLLFDKLDSYSFSGINTVLIERQPKLATEKMRSLAYAIFDYFILKFRTISVEWIDPKNKLYVYSGPVIQCDIKNQYDRNKWFACKYCLWNLNEKKEDEYLDFFIKNKKQDDLADCYLQGLFYIEKKDKKSSIMSEQQRNIYTEQNLIKYKKIKARKPMNKSAKIMLSGIKYFIKRNEITEAVLNSIAFYFGTIAIEKLY